MSIQSQALALGAALALMVAAGAQPATAKKRGSAVRTVTKMLTGVYLTTYTSGASAESTVHLCGGGRFLLISSSNVSTDTDDPSSYDHPSVGGESRTMGNWRVLRVPACRATAGRPRRWWATARTPARAAAFGSPVGLVGRRSAGRRLRRGAAGCVARALELRH